MNEPFAAMQQALAAFDAQIRRDVQPLVQKAMEQLVTEFAGRWFPMSEEQTFLATIRTNPADVTTRLVYADFLDERERHIDAALQRVLACPADDTHRLNYADAAERVGQHERAEFIRVQCELVTLDSRGQCPRCRITLSPLKKDMLPLLAGCTKCGYQGGFWSDAVKAAHRESTLRARERELLQTTMFPPPFVNVFVALEGDNLSPATPSAILHRGFARRVTCTAEDWLKHADAILDAHPVERVTLTSAPERLCSPDKCMQLRAGVTLYQTSIRWRGCLASPLVDALEATFPRVKFTTPSDNSDEGLPLCEQCGKRAECLFCPNPYAEELYGDGGEPQYWCDACYQDACDDI